MWTADVWIADVADVVGGSGAAASGVFAAEVEADSGVDAGLPELARCEIAGQGKYADGDGCTVHNQRPLDDWSGEVHLNFLSYCDRECSWVHPFAPLLPTQSQITRSDLVHTGHGPMDQDVSAVSEDRC